ncbi:50S ribosomal protein L17 [Spirobacillus cienkowskii]|jgi:large subunit ribosomal protein L17|uniref:Large ribosomal subunit protein bL17 n=1 Tax=Spirobacillus cienkowskii TaxID=495820 RepID=A0A369KTT5_9BACT|nr:MAG: 50S ribosomal protein L17 [Spirobacillus cienkowskii]
MRHRLAHRKLNRDSAGRKALLRGLATQLIEHGTVVTTVERAKELRKIVEPLVALARVDSVNNRRNAASTLYTKKSVGDLFSRVAPANAQRNGGYTRILRLGFRPGDHARRAIIEFVEPTALKAVNATQVAAN